MTKARDLADLISAGNPLADGAISVSEISDLTATAAEINQLDGTADLPDIRPSLLLDFANSKTLDPRITFTRGSTATYWDGKTTAKAEENLLLRSQDFDHSYWEKARIDITANATTAPDGTTTAEAINQASGQTQIGRIFRSNLPNSAGAYTASVYAKANTRNFVTINTNDFINTGFNYTWFNLSTGAVGTNYSGHTASITDVGNGWYRCSITFTSVAAGSAGDVGFGLADTDGSETCADEQNGIYLWGAQLEQRSSATAYTATTSSPIVKYQPVLQTAASGEARFDHDPVTGESKGLLIEEARTNLFNQSEDFTAGNWSASQATLTQNVVAPDGTLTAWSLQENTAASVQHLIQYNAGTVTVGDVYTLSVFAKGAGRRLSLTSFGMGYSAFDLDDGEVDNVGGFDSATIEDVGNGWYRCSITLTKTNTNGNFYIITYSPTGHVYTGDGYSGIYLWGAQLEAGSFPTSYIPTSGSTVTRAVDDAKITGDNFSSFFSADAFSIYREINMGWDMLRSPSATAVLKIDNLSSNTLTMRVVTDTSAPQIDVTLSTFGATYADTADNNNISGYTSFKQALAIDPTSLFSHATGAAGGTDTSILLANDYSRMQLNADEDRNWIKKIAFYPKKLTLTQLSAMVEE